MNGKIIVRERITKWEGNIELNNCKDSLNYNMCYKYFNMTADFCDVFDEASELLGQVTPTLKCPMEATTYTIKGLPVKDHATSYMPDLDGTSYWNIIVSGFDNKKMISCLVVQFQMSLKRRGG